MSKTVTLEADVDAELNRVAAETGCSKAWLVNEALRFFVASEQQFLAAVEEGKQAMREGRMIDHRVVAASFDKLVDKGP